MKFYQVRVFYKKNFFCREKYFDSTLIFKSFEEARNYHCDFELGLLEDNYIFNCNQIKRYKIIELLYND